jgi:CheY-like chemotaxis protein
MERCPKSDARKSLLRPLESSSMRTHIARVVDSTTSAFPAPNLAPRGARPWRVLLVEDDFETQGAVANLLRDEGYEVDCAANGAEALLILEGKAELPALIILDFWMPQMDGAQFRAAQIADPRLAGIPVLVTTAVKPKSGTWGMVEMPMLMKPLGTKALLSAIEELRSNPGT